MRLILERKINDEGWVNIKKFIEETELKISGHYQLIFRLRQNLQKILNEKETKELIKNKKSGLYRILTNPDFIIYRKDDLVKNYSNNKLINRKITANRIFFYKSPALNLKTAYKLQYILNIYYLHSLQAL